MSKRHVLKEFFDFLMRERKYWLIPLVAFLLLLGLLVVFSQTSAIAPFVYTLF
jgi:hypothetical protein